MAKTLWNMNNRRPAVAMIQGSLKDRGFTHDAALVERALESLFAGASVLTADAGRPTDPESELLQFRRAEFTIIRREVNDSLRIPNLRVIPSEVSDEIAPWFAKVNLVERLRETRVFYGFDRLERARQPLLGMPNRR